MPAELPYLPGLGDLQPAVLSPSPAEGLLRDVVLPAHFPDVPGGLGHLQDPDGLFSANRARFVSPPVDSPTGIQLRGRHQLRRADQQIETEDNPSSFLKRSIHSGNPVVGGRGKGTRMVAGVSVVAAARHQLARRRGATEFYCLLTIGA